MTSTPWMEHLCQSGGYVPCDFKCRHIPTLSLSLPLARDFLDVLVQETMGFGCGVGVGDGNVTEGEFWVLRLAM